MIGHEKVNLIRDTVVVRTEPGHDRERSIVAAALTVRSADWRPIAEEVTVQTAEGQVRYEIDQIDHHVLASASMPSDFFDPPSAAVARVLPPLPSVAPEPVPPPAPAPAPAEPAESISSNLETQITQHRAGLCSHPTLRDDVAQQITSRLSLSEPETVSVVSLWNAIGDDARSLRLHTKLSSDVDNVSVSPGLDFRFHQILDEHVAAMRSNLAQVAALLGVPSAPSDAVPHG